MSSASPVSSDAQSEFVARLERIKASQGKSLVMVGQGEQHVVARKEVVQITRSREIAGNALYPASLLGAVLLGMVAVMISQYARFQLMAGSSEPADADTDMLVTVGISMVLSFVLTQAFKLTSKEHRALQGIGVLLMVSTFHNLSHWLPGPMGMAFSPAYVQTTTATSTPNSLRFGGASFQLFPAATDTTAAPDAEAALLSDAAVVETPKAKPVTRKAGKIVPSN